MPEFERKLKLGWMERHAYGRIDGNVPGGWEHHASRCPLNCNSVILVGRSHCTDPILDGPAIWTARVEEDMISEWRVWEDSPPTRKRLGLTIS